MTQGGIKLGKIIAVVSGKGGTGKTSFTANVGLALAALGCHTLCLDCDITLRNLDLALGLSDRALMDFTDVIAGRCTLEDAVVQHPKYPKLHLLTAPLSARPMPIAPEQMKALLDRIRQTYDYCLIDAPAGLGMGFHLASDYADRAVVVTNTDTSSLRYFTTLAHEGFPGHLYQTVMSYEAGLHPVRFLLNYPGYVEGWATYVEMISYHYAGLDDDLASLLSLNQSALLSLYASTDLGIHYDGWSFSDTTAFWKDFGITDQTALREIYELIVEEPAHYLKYYVGYMEFVDLKEKAQETYGSAYSDIAFHKALLSIGPAPFSIIETYLDDYYLPDAAPQ